MKKIIMITLVIGVLTACVREIDDLNFTVFKPGVSFPLGQISMTASTLTQIGDSLDVREGEAQVIEFFYKTEVLDALLGDRFTFGDQAFSNDIPFTSFLFTAGETDKVKFSQFDSFNISNIDLTGTTPELTRVTLKEGSITIDQSKDFSHEVETTITFPKLTKSGQSLKLRVINNQLAREDLNGYELDLTGTTGDEVNTIDYELSTIVTESGSSTVGTINFDFNISSMRFRSLEGNFFTYEFDQVNAEFDLNLPQEDVPDNVRFTNPVVKLIVDNSSGIEYGLDITEISVVEENNDILQVTGSYKAETAIVSPARLRGETTTSEYFIDNSNTDNLSELISIIPESAFFSGVAIANPNGTPPEGNFITDESRMVVSAEIILPLEGYANNYAINETINDVDLEFDDEGVVSLDNINLRFQSENSFPFDVRLQAYFLDATEQQVVIDSLYLEAEDQLIISSGVVNSEGIVTESTTKVANVTLTQEKYEKVKLAKAIRIKASILTSGADQNPRQSVKFTTDNSLSIGLGVSGNAVVDLNKIDN